MKKLLSLLLALMLVASLSITLYAGPDNGEYPPTPVYPAEELPETPEPTTSSEEVIIPDIFAASLEDAAAKGIPFDEPGEKTDQELIDEDIPVYGVTVPWSNFDNERAIVSGVLAYVRSSGNQTVYSTASTSGSSLGYVSYREIVYVISVSGTYAYIEFENGSHVLTRGYVPTTALYTPALGWSVPIKSGTISQYYGSILTDTNGHTGIDVAVASGTSVYAAFAGSAQYAEVTITVNGTKLFAGYGKHIQLTSGSYKLIYAHLSSFNGVSSSSYSSTGSLDQKTYKNYARTTVAKATQNVSKGATIGYVGATGYSTGAHLHFEVRLSGTIKDPFNYIVFPKVSWANPSAM
ncbi:MAG: M23 family metallopeptidase [Oscillospiraceae bacterium]|jgi:murein DD-endopeptidase MepM/ murein hydrolase activator NlpD|nr:M23 family metallopeptidase [Oscillospiraceae bacterium]